MRQTFSQRSVGVTSEAETTKQLTIAIGFVCKKKYYESQYGPETTYFTYILQNIIFCAQQKKETHTGLEQLGGELIRALWNQFYFFPNSVFFFR